MEADPLADLLFAEIRSEKNKQVSFASFDLKSGRINFDNLLSDERWLAGIETAYNGVLLLHNYQSARSPEHKGLIAFDGITGKALWQNYNQSFNHLTMNGPVVYDARLQPRKFYVADIKSGFTISGYDPSVDKDVINKILLPDIVPADSIGTIELPEKPYGNIVHNIYYNNFRIVSLHAQNNAGLTQSLYVYKQGQQIFGDILNTGIQKLQPEAFVLHHHYLIYLKNRTVLNVINLKTE